MTRLEFNAARDARSPWRFGRFDGRTGNRRLLFGRMFEDPAIEQSLFSPGNRVFCIASAGCTAFELARHGCHVTAIDINPVQISYVRRRASGGRVEQGSTDRGLAVARKFTRLLGVRRTTLEAFAGLDDATVQLDFWREHFDRPLLKATIRLALSRSVLRFPFASPFVRSLPVQFGDILWSRVERGIGLHPNRTNPFAALLFLGAVAPTATEPLDDGACLELMCGDAADFLERCPAHSFHGFTLSNILDGAPTEYAGRLVCAVQRAAVPDAIVVIRSFAEPHDDEESDRAAGDRSFLWGRIAVQRAEEWSS
jgi:hypothetical protein